MGNTTAQQESQSIRDKFPFEPERVSKLALCVRFRFKIIVRFLGRRWFTAHRSYSWAKTEENREKMDEIIRLVNALHFRIINLNQLEGPVAFADLTAMDGKYEYEYLIKFKNMSYTHVQWLSAGDIGQFFEVIFGVCNRYFSYRGDEPKE